jgi:Flp pilus assembly pilin Flp
LPSPTYAVSSGVDVTFIIDDPEEKEGIEIGGNRKGATSHSACTSRTPNEENTNLRESTRIYTNPNNGFRAEIAEGTERTKKRAIVFSVLFVPSAVSARFGLRAQPALGRFVFCPASAAGIADFVKSAILLKRPKSDKWRSLSAHYDISQASKTGLFRIHCPLPARAALPSSQAAYPRAARRCAGRTLSFAPLTATDPCYVCDTHGRLPCDTPYKGVQMIANGKFGSFKSLLNRLACDEQGAETIEWVLVVGLIAVVCIVAMKGFGITLTNWWTSSDNGM